MRSVRRPLISWLNYNAYVRVGGPAVEEAGANRFPHTASAPTGVPPDARGFNRPILVVVCDYFGSWTSQNNSYLRETVRCDRNEGCAP